MTLATNPRLETRPYRHRGVVLRSNKTGSTRTSTANTTAADTQTLQRSSAQDRPVSFPLDTNVVSEWTKPQPNSGVARAGQ